MSSFVWRGTKHGGVSEATGKVRLPCGPPGAACCFPRAKEQQ